MAFYYLLLIFIWGNILLADSETRRQLDLHFQQSMKTSDHTSTPFKRVTRLFHTVARRKSRKHVSINKEVVSTNGEDNKTHLVIESDSFGTIKIHSYEEPVYYLCIGTDHKPIGVAKTEIDLHHFDSENCVFKEREAKKKYIMFQSVKYYNKTLQTGCLAFTKHGKGRKITRSRCGHKNTLFLMRESEFIIDTRRNSSNVKKKLYNLLRNDSKS